MTKVSLAQEIGTTIRAAITEWPQTLRLVSLLAAASGPAALILLLILLRHPSMSTPTIPTETFAGIAVVIIGGCIGYRSGDG
ncbi:MAG: hypothetical protein JO115_17900 [Pseudonocardiales bacterium]|nr:hypothetical protein [Pseudonocardiales bacterium]